jgi:hypothetical protein
VQRRDDDAADLAGCADLGALVRLGCDPGDRLLDAGRAIADNAGAI